MKKVRFSPILVVMLVAYVFTSCTKDNPKPAELVSISVKTPPTKVNYYVGEDLDLSGLVIELTLDNGVNSDVAFSDFASGGLNTSPENGTELTNELTEITIMHTETGITTNQTITLFITLTDIDGNIYSYIKIGNQIWMKENLKTTKYQNGDDIETTNPVSLDISEETSPKYQWAYNGDENNVTTYGRLYTQHVATDSRNVCPVDWHVPSENEFLELTTYLIANGYNYDSTTIGNKIGKSLAATTNWDSYTYLPGVPGNDFETNNSSGFTGLPSGFRINSSDFFLAQHVSTYWWSIDTNNDGLGIAFRIQNFQMEADIVTIGDKNTGAPIRCIKD